jgi:hypothetical protein
MNIEVVLVHIYTSIHICLCIGQGRKGLSFVNIGMTLLQNRGEVVDRKIDVLVRTCVYMYMDSLHDSRINIQSDRAYNL